MADTTMQIIVKAVDQASATINTIGGHLKSMKPIFKGMAVAGTVAFGAISAIGIKAVKDYADAEKSAAMLQHAVIDVTHATQEQLKATSDLADALEKKGVLDGDNIKMGLAQLSTFGLSNKAVQALGGSLSDLAVNQFGVSASGEQLSDSANMIAKALNGQFGVLEKSGIRFTDAQKHVIQFGTEMQKVDAINQGFAQNLKFTNEVALGTTEGQMAKVSVQVGNLSESLGKILVPIIAQVTAVIVPFLTKLQAWIEANPELTKNIILVTAAVAAVVAVVGTLGLIIPAVIAGFTALAALGPLVGAAMTFMLGPVGLVILAIAALIAGGVLLWKHWDQVKAKAMEIWESIKNFIIEHWRTILLVIGGGLGAIIILIVDNWGAITAAWDSIWQSVSGVLVSIMDSAKGVIAGMINWVIDKINGAISLANGAISLANNIPGVNISTIPTVPKMADGGIVNSPTLAMIGEAGPEAVVPLNGNKGLGNNITINIGNLWGANPQSAAREIGDLIIKRLQMNARVG